ncbi:NAD(P)H-binding protein [Danxiaibacter flavus]|uniref:NAD(P)H-binding protein n=1 Tax=Danxiaibacter flavus TaxID=3049108 RepID=A0ABV3ZIH4_9BACT|nr:NAD(P)H-binding protein [Chitinophagaceae bacterium DXS]
MKITVSGSLGHIGKPLTTKLVAAGHDVTVITSSADRREEIEALGAKATVGSVSDESFLAKAFAGADAVFAMIPPNLGGSNVIANATNAGKAFAAAIKAAAVPRVVMLSSIGADLPSGNGPIAALYNIEHLYSALKDVALTYLRAGYFFTNYYNDIPLIKGAGIIGSNYPGSTVIPLAHYEDIATAAAEELQKTSAGQYVRYVISDVRTPREVAKVLGSAINKPELPWVEFTDEQSVQGMTGAGLPDEIARLYTEMGTGLRNGTVVADFVKSGSPVTGRVKLEDFAKEFAAKF